MIYRIKSTEMAEAILRASAASEWVTGYMVFDLDESITRWKDIPIVYRRCDHGGCKNPSEYIGWNRNGTNFDRTPTYCRHCGFHMETLAEAALVIQGCRVIDTSWRTVEASVV